MKMKMGWFSSMIPVAMCIVLATASRNALAQTTANVGANTAHHSRYTLRRHGHREQQQPRGRRMTDAEMAHAVDHYFRHLADEDSSLSMNLGTNRFIEDPSEVVVPRARAKGISSKYKSNDKGKSGKSSNDNNKESKSGSKQEKKKKKNKSGSSKAGSNKLTESKGKGGSSTGGAMAPRRLRVVESGAEQARFRSSRIRADATSTSTSSTATATSRDASSSWKSDRRLIGTGCTYEMGWTTSSKEGSKEGSKARSKTGGRGKDGRGRVGRDRGRRRIEMGVFNCRVSGSFACCQEWGDSGDDELCCRTEAASTGGNEQSNDGEDDNKDDNKDDNNEKSGGAKRYSEDYFYLNGPDGPVPQIRPNSVDEESKSNDFPF